MAKEIYVNALDLRKQLGELLNRIYYQGITVYVKRRGRVIAKIEPMETASNVDTLADATMTAAQPNAGEEVSVDSLRGSNVTGQL